VVVVSGHPIDATADDTLLREASGMLLEPLHHRDLVFSARPKSAAVYLLRDGIDLCNFIHGNVAE
jgi:hypothetical protein